MVKRTTIRQRLNKKESKKSADKDVTCASSSSDGSSPQAPVGNVASLRLKRKVTKKMKFLSKLQENKQILSIKPAIAKRRRRQKKSALHSLSSLADVLPALQGTLTEEKPTYLSKKKQANIPKLVVHETKQLSKVLDHPEFKSNPFTAIQQHLAKTLRGSQVEDTSMKSVTKERSKKRRHKQKKIHEL